MDIRLDEKVALVTGGSRGIGLAIAQDFVDAGARVMLVAREKGALDEAASGFPQGAVDVYAADIGKPEDAEAGVAAAVQRFGGLDILVNNAAMSSLTSSAMDIPTSEIDKTMEINQRGPLLWSQQAWHQAFATNGGVIVNISSVGAYRTVRGLAVYNMSKAALVYLTQQLAYELAPSVRVVGIAPGLVLTTLARQLPDLEDRAAKIPMRRIGAPTDISAAVTFVASDSASWLTGQTIIVDGGGSLRPMSGE